MTERSVYRLKAGNTDRLKITQENLQKPGALEVQVTVHSIGLNFADVFAILGLYSATPKGLFIPGLEFAGVVNDVGDKVEGIKVGQRVMGVTRFGAYASHLNQDHRFVVPIPDDWTFQDGASYLVQVLTAYYGLKSLGDVREGKTVLIHSVAGGVGIWANRICRQIGAYTIGTVGREEKVELALSEGVDKVMIRNPKTFGEELTAVLGDRRLDLIMECIGGKIMKAGFDTLGAMGRLVVYGSAHYGNTSRKPNYFKLIPRYLTRPKIDPQNMIAQNKSVMAFNLIYLFEEAELMHVLLKELSDMNLGKPIIGHSFSFDDLPDAIRLFQSGNTVGKVVVNIPKE